MFDDVLTQLLFQEGSPPWHRIKDISYPDDEFCISINTILRTLFSSHGPPLHVEHGHINRGNLEHDLQVIRTIGEDLTEHDEKILVKAAHLMYHFFTSHSFMDGNKRTGFTVGLIFLVVNGREPIATIDRQYMDNAEFFQQLASGRREENENIAKLLSWIRENTKKINDLPAP